MSCRAVPFALTFLLVLDASLRADDWPAPESLDRQRLHQAGLTTDPAELLALVEPPTASAERLAELLAALGEPEYDRREAAGRELVRLGRPTLVALADLSRTASLDERRQARLLIEEIEGRLAPATTLAVLRTLCRLKHPRAVSLVLQHLPEFDEANRHDLVLALLRTNPTTAAAETALRRALVDAASVRRSAAGLVLARAGSTESVPAVLPLLRDTDELVRLRTAQGLLGRGDERGLPALVGLLDAPLDLAWQAEELLRWIAGDTAPKELLGTGTATNRRLCRQAWQTWLALPVRTIEWTTLRQAPRRPGLYLTCRGDRVELVGSDGGVRFTVDNSVGGTLTDAQLLPGGRVLLFDDNEGEVRLVETEGKAVWKWKAPAGEIAQTLQLLPEENRIVAVTDEQIHELTLTGKHLGALRLGDMFFLDACRIDSGRYAALTDEGFYLVARTTGQLLAPLQVPGMRLNYFPDSGKLLPLGDGMLALLSPQLERVVLFDAVGSASEGPPVGRSRGVFGLARQRDGSWLLGQSHGASRARLGELASDGRVVREVLLAQRVNRFRIVLEDIRLGLVEVPPGGFTVDSADYRIAALRSGDPEVRRRAAGLLGQYRDQAELVIPALIDTLDSDDAVLQQNAAKSLAQLGPIALPPLLRALRESPKRARLHAIRGIGELRLAAVPAVPALIRILKNAAREQALCVAVCEALALIGPAASPACPALRDAVTETDPALRRAAVIALGCVGQGEAENLQTLIAVLDDRDDSLVVAAANALARFGARARSAVPHLLLLVERPVSGPRAVDTLDRRRAATTALGEIGVDPGETATRTIDVLVEIVRDRKEPLDQRQLCVRTLTKIGPSERSALPVFRELLLAGDQPNNLLASDLFRALVALKHQGGIGVLIEAARTGPESVRYSAVTQLGSLGAEGHSAVGALNEMNAVEKSVRVRTAIQRALKRIPLPPAA